MDREKATIGIFVSLDSFTDPMRKEALSAGYYDPEHLGPQTQSPTHSAFHNSRPLGRSRTKISPSFDKHIQKG